MCVMSSTYGRPCHCNMIAGPSLKPWKPGLHDPVIQFAPPRGVPRHRRRRPCACWTWVSVPLGLYGTCEGSGTPLCAVNACTFLYQATENKIWHGNDIDELLIRAVLAGRKYHAEPRIFSVPRAPITLCGPTLPASEFVDSGSPSETSLPRVRQEEHWHLDHRVIRVAPEHEEEYNHTPLNLQV